MLRLNETNELLLCPQRNTCVALYASATSPRTHGLARVMHSVDRVQKTGSEPVHRPLFSRAGQLIELIWRTR